MSALPLPHCPPSIRVASTIELTEAEGPGSRFAIWTQGCTLACPDCCNPHLWNAQGGEAWTASALLERVLAARERRPELEGVTLIGGEPFEQDAALAPLAEGLREAGLTVMAFTGYRLEDLAARHSPLLPHVDLLVDGPYERERYTSGRRFIGSTNQRMHFLSPAYQPDDPRFAEPNTAELRYDGEGDVQVVGFPFPSVRDAFGPKREGSQGGLLTLREAVSERLQALGATLSPSRFGGELAFHLGRREVAHFHDAFTLDLRITRKGFHALGSELREDRRIVSKDAGKRDWIEVRFRRRIDLPFVETLARHALQANR